MKKIKTMLILNYTILLFCTVVIAVFGIVGIRTVSNRLHYSGKMVAQPLGHLAEIAIPYGSLRTSVRDLYRSVEMAEKEALAGQVMEDYESLKAKTAVYVDLLELNKENVDIREYEIITEIYENLETYRVILEDEFIPLCLSGDEIVLPEDLNDDIKYQSAVIREGLEILIPLNLQQAEANTVYGEQVIKQTTILFFGVLVLVFLITMFTGSRFIASTVRPLHQLVDLCKQIQAGSFHHIEAKRYKYDEINILSSTISSMVRRFHQLLEDINQMAAAHKEGKINTYIETGKYQGIYGTLAAEVNEMVKNYVDDDFKILAYIGAFADGDFSVDIVPFKGEKELISHALEDVKMKLADVGRYTNHLLDCAMEGNLAGMPSEFQHAGEWRQMVQRLDRFLQSIAHPVEEAKSVLECMAEGGFDNRIQGDYHGVFESIKGAINKTQEEIAGYIYEIRDMVTALSQNNYTYEITREYKGAFATIKTGLNALMNQYNDITHQIRETIQDVFDGALQVTGQSAIIAKGAENQSAIIESLSSEIETISNQASVYLQNTETVDKISDESKQKTVAMNHHMESLLVSIDSIDKATENISSVIKMITDISFQTNLLALNASVEAARAGVHGKGFSVVAEEVRSLAEKSRLASEETEILIQDTRKKVEEGKQVAEQTATVLKEVLSEIRSISEAIEQISTESKNQVQSIEQISQGVNGIAKVALDNAEIATETAAESEKFTNAAQYLNELFNDYKLK